MISFGVLITVYLRTRGLARGFGDKSSLLACDIQLDNMRVSQELQIFDLALDATSHVSADELLSGDDLERDLLAGAIMNSQLDLSEGALAECLDDLVGADTLLRLNLVPQRGGGIDRRSHVEGVGWLKVVVSSGGGGGGTSGGTVLLGASTDLGGREADMELLLVEAGSHVVGRGEGGGSGRFCLNGLWPEQALDLDHTSGHDEVGLWRGTSTGGGLPRSSLVRGRPFFLLASGHVWVVQAPQEHLRSTLQTGRPPAVVGR